MCRSARRRSSALRGSASPWVGASDDEEERVKSRWWLSAALGFWACSGGRAFTRGTYEDPATIEMLSDQFNENDLQLIAKKMVSSLLVAPGITQLEGRPTLVIRTFKNSTSEHIDMKSLADKLQVALLKAGRFSFQDVSTRKDVAAEYAYQRSGAVDPAKAQGPGQQVAADYVLTGEISSIVQQVGADKTVYYKMTSKLTNVKSGLVEWSDEKELRKKFEKQSVTW
jgi:uncharacterized protein (TIGR02722 family)